LSAISIKQLLEAGVHFGHQTSRWNPKMREYIFGERNGIHIIDLQKTLRLFKEAVDFLTELGAQGKEVLFVGTKRQAQEAIEEDAKRCGMHFVTNRWLGGFLTNFETVRNSLKRYKELETLKKEGYQTKFTSKKEISKLERERKKLEKNLRGIANLERLPDALFVIDSDNESIAVKEASRLGIPVVAVVDTNCDPDEITYLIPGNDDALRSVKLFTATVADSIAAGRAIWETKLAEERKAREEAERQEAARAAAQRAAAEARKVERERRAAEIRAAEAAAAEAAKAAAAVQSTPVAAPVPASVETAPAAAEAASEERAAEKKSGPRKAVAKKPTGEKSSTEESEKAASVADTASTSETAGDAPSAS